MGGQGAWNQKELDEANKAFTTGLQRFEEHLALRTYLVGHSVTLADLMFTATLTANRSTLATADQMSAFPNVLRHYNYMTSTTFFTSVMGRAFQPMKASLPLADSNLTKAHGASLNTTAAS